MHDNTWLRLREVRLSAAHDYTRDGEEPLSRTSTYSEQYPEMWVYIIVSNEANASQHHCCSNKINLKE